MKKLIITLAIIFFGISSISSQSTNSYIYSAPKSDIYSRFAIKSGLNDSLQKGFSLNLGIGYLTPVVSDLFGGLTFQPSISLNTSKSVSWFTEFSFSRHWHERDSDAKYFVYYMLINLGLRDYSDNGSGFYYKYGIGADFSWLDKKDLYYYFSLNFGIGNDFKISNKICLFAESDILFHPPLIVVAGHSLFDINLSAGIKYKL